MSRIWEENELAAQELERVKCELDQVREGVRAWVEQHRGQLDHSAIFQLYAACGMKVL
jgi:hypothetical protein